jgi:hypothetical protein
VTVCFVDDWLEPGENGDDILDAKQAQTRWFTARQTWAQQTGFRLSDYIFELLHARRAGMVVEPLTRRRV